MRRRIRSYLFVSALAVVALCLWHWPFEAMFIIRRDLPTVCQTLSRFDEDANAMTKDKVSKTSRNEKAQPFEKLLTVPDNEKPVFLDYKPGHTRHVILVDGEYTQHFSPGSTCLIEGTTNFSTNCVCKNGWHGNSCSIPDFVDETKFNNRTNLRVRTGPPRRLVYGTTFNMEFEMLELRLGEVGDLIDVILIVESNYTGFGQPKPLFLLQKLRNGYLKEYQHKIVHLFVDFFPTGSNPKDGAYTDFFLKNYAGLKGLDFVQGLKKDDIFIYADADELHRREALLFLKLHDGYPEPVGGYLRRNVFGFFWSSGISYLGFASSIDMLQVVYKNKCSEVRGATSSEHKYIPQLERYRKLGHNVQMWQMGNSSAPSLIAGWHCSWCFDIERVRTKLVSAFNYDFPRWGDYPEKTKVNYIKKLVKQGLWFDDKSTYKPQYIDLHAPYAPAYALKHSVQYFKLLFNPYHSL